MSSDSELLWHRWASLYRRAGLKPWDDFLFEVLGNRSLATYQPGKGYRRIGITTWMAARAALDLEDGKSIAVVAETRSHVDVLRDAVIRFVRVLDPSATISNQLNYQFISSSRSGFKNDPRLYSEVRPPRTPNAMPGMTQSPVPGVRNYLNSEWQDRLTRRAHGPFAMLREIRFEKDRWVAYAEDDEELLELPVETVLSYEAQGFPVKTNRKARKLLKHARLRPRERLLPAPGTPGGFLSEPMSPFAEPGRSDVPDGSDLAGG